MWLGLRLGLGLGLASRLMASLSEGLRQGAGEEASVVGVEDYREEDDNVCCTCGCPRVFGCSRTRAGGGCGVLETGKVGSAVDEGVREGGKELGGTRAHEYRRVDRID